MGGTCHHVLPVAQMLAASVRTIGVPRQPRPPYLREEQGLFRDGDSRQEIHNAVHVGVAVAGNDHAVGKSVALLAHDLVANAAARRVKVHAVLFGKGLDCPVLFDIGVWVGWRVGSILLV